MSGLTESQIELRSVRYKDGKTAVFHALQALAEQKPYLVARIVRRYRQTSEEALRTLNSAWATVLISDVKRKARTRGKKR